jgi:rhamnosyltransferase
MSRDPLTTGTIAIAFTTFNPEFEFQEYVHVAASECEHVLVVDDGSASDCPVFRDAEWVPSNVTVIEKSTNSGIADSVNIALEYSKNIGAEYLMFFDQDTVVYSGLISRTVESALRYRATSERPLGCLGAGVIHGRKYLAGEAAVISNVSEVIQSGTVFSVDALDAIGGANSGLFIDVVDTDICLRMRARGYSVVIDRSIYICHPIGSGGSIDILGHSVMITNHSPMRRYYLTRNRLYILRQFRWWRLDLRWCLVYSRRFVVSCVIALVFEKQRYQKFRAITFGVIDGFRGRLGKRSFQ